MPETFLFVGLGSLPDIWGLFRSQFRMRISDVCFCA